MLIRNLFSEIPAKVSEEIFEDIIANRHFKLERIVSNGNATPEGQWYDQDMDEWVILLAGEAGLFFENETDVRILKPGDYLHIPAHARHRVAWTKENEKTIWLAIHFRNEWP